MSGPDRPAPEEFYSPEVLERLRSFPIEEAEELVDKSYEIWPPAPDEDTGPSHGPPAWMGRHLDPYADLSVVWSERDADRFEQCSLARYEFRDEARDLLTRFHVGRADPFIRDDEGNPTMQGGGHGKRRRKVPNQIQNWIWERDGTICQLCGVGRHVRLRWWKGTIRRNSSEVQFCIDHILPTNAHGPHMAWNLWILCHPCNQRKSHALWPEMLEEAFSRLKEVREWLE